MGGRAHGLSIVLTSETGMPRELREEQTSAGRDGRDIQVEIQSGYVI